MRMPTVIAAPGNKAAHLQYVDALRGWAILGVIIVHCFGSVTGLDPLLSNLAKRGANGVQLFFVMSAFTLFLSFRAHGSAELNPVRNFFIRRFFRIAPMFYLAILFYPWWYGTGASFYAPEGLNAFQIVSTALFLHGWNPSTINAVVPGDWSIAAEMVFYVFVPILFLLARTPIRALLIFAGSLALSLVFHIFRVSQRLYPDYAGQPILDEFSFFWLPSQLPAFCLGIILYWLVQIDRSADDETLPMGKLTSKSSAGMLLAGLGITLCLSNTVFVPEHVSMSIAFCIGAWGLSRYPAKLLVNKPICYLGRLSYSAYIVHFAILDVLKQLVGAVPLYTRFNPRIAQEVIRAPLLNGLSPPLQFGFLLLTVTLATVAVSAVTYHLVELPGQKTGKWIIQCLVRWGSRKASVAVSDMFPLATR